MKGESWRKCLETPREDEDEGAAECEIASSRMNSTQPRRLQEIELAKRRKVSIYESSGTINETAVIKPAGLLCCCSYEGGKKASGQKD